MNCEVCEDHPKGCNRCKHDRDLLLGSLYKEALQSQGIRSAFDQVYLDPRKLFYRGIQGGVRLERQGQAFNAGL